MSGEKILLGKVCKDCMAINNPFRRVCYNCGSKNLDHAKLSTEGEIKTFTIIHVPPVTHKGEEPYIVVVVEFPEGFRITGRLFPEHEMSECNIIGRKVKISNYKDGIYWFNLTE